MKIKMKIKYSLLSIFIATFTLCIFLHYWPSDAARKCKRATNLRQEIPNKFAGSGLETIGLNTKYQFFISRLKKSGG